MIIQSIMIMLAKDLKSVLQSIINLRAILFLVIPNLSRIKKKKLTQNIQTPNQNLFNQILKKNNKKRFIYPTNNTLNFLCINLFVTHSL